MRYLFLSSAGILVLMAMSAGIIIESNHLIGEPEEVTQVHNLEHVRELTISGPFDVKVTQGYGELVLKGSKSLLSNVTVFFYEGKLIVRTPEDFSVDKKIPLTLSSNSIERMELRGRVAGTANIAHLDQIETIGLVDFTLSELDTPLLKIKQSGSNTLRISGRTPEVHLESFGGTRINMENLDVARVTGATFGKSVLLIPEETKQQVSTMGSFTLKHKNNR